MADMMVKAKQIEYLINSLPQPESEEEQVRPCSFHEGLRANVDMLDGAFGSAGEGDDEGQRGVCACRGAC